MSLTQSNMMPLGTKAPSFNLPDVVSGKVLSLEELQSEKGTVVMFICNHCPYVKHIQKDLVELAHEYKKKGISFVGINSNDIENYPEDSPKNMKKEAKKWRYSFPYLFDETQSIAKAYQAACTPDFYIFGKDLKCVYRGRMDESSPGNNIPVTGKDLKMALDALLSEKPISKDQKPSMGCNIKWK
ncbi:MAG: thioredoxin family protein [Deltaproteobacteria bacterium]|nr:thioredoxin family protein [Deltaproteobacteria bacterium]